jgi:hypothetical protein
MVGDLDYSLIPGRKPFGKRVGEMGVELYPIPAALYVKISNLFKTFQLVNISPATLGLRG